MREKYENPTYFQSQYPIINFFYYVAVKYKILETNSAATGLQEGRNYQHFTEASVWEQPGGEGQDREYWWEIEALPLLEMVSDLYENTEIEEDAVMDGRDIADLDAVIQCAYEAYTKKLVKEPLQDRSG